MLPAVLSSPTKYQIIFLNSFPFDWYVIPLLLLGALTSPCAPFQQVNNKKTQKNRRFFVRLPTIACNTCLVASTSGFCRSSGPPLLKDARGIVPVHHHSHEMASKYGALFVVFFLHATLLSAWMIQSKYLPGGSIQWLLVKHWTPPLSNICGIALAHHSGHWNKLQRWCTVLRRWFWHWP